MQRPEVVVVVALVVLVPFVASSPTAAEHENDVTVTGTVTGVDGDPATDAVILIGEDSTLTTFSPAELREVATDPPQNLTVVNAGSNGRFEATLGSLRAEAAVAVSDAGVSDLVYIRGENATLSLQLHERRPQTVHAHLGTVAADERRAELYVNLGNSGDATIENLSVTLESLPEGWTVTNVSTKGTYHPDTGTLTWSSVAPGTEIDTTVVLTVPEGAPVGTYTVRLRAESDTHRVGVQDETVEVLPEDTATPTQLPGHDIDESSPTPDVGERTATPSDEMARPDESSTGATGPGIGAVAAVVALVVLATLVHRS